jgi:hypothetical protein
MGVEAEIHGPEVRRRAEELEAYQGLPGAALDYARHAAGQFLIGAQVGDQHRVGTLDITRNFQQAALRADVGCLGMFGKRLTLETAINKNGQRGRQPRTAPLIETLRRILSGVLRNAEARIPRALFPAPSREKFAPKHYCTVLRARGFGCSRVGTTGTVVYTEVVGTVIETNLYDQPSLLTTDSGWSGMRTDA